MSHSMPCILLFIFCFFLYSTSSFSRSTLSPFTTSPYVASKQLMFWSDNVINKMPETLVPKLSPLSVSRSAYFTLLVSDGSIASDSIFCSLANLSCNTNLSHVRTFMEGYGYGRGTISSHLGKVDKHSFFRLSKLKEGNEVYVPVAHDNYPSRAFLPYEIASKISIDLKVLQKLFPQSFKYETTREAIEITVSYCNAPVLKGEIKSCLSSLEGMISFAKNALGQKHVRALASKNINHSFTKLTIDKITKFNAEKIVACHDLFLPFSTYFCHVLSSTHLYAVDVVDSKTRLAVKTTFVVCHMDTSAWPATHVAFKILNSSPGNGEACHWMTHMGVVFISGREKNSTIK